LTDPITRSRTAWAADLALAHELAAEAHRVSAAFFRQPIKRWRKSDGSLVTEADIAVEKALRARLAVARPDDAILGEEEGQTGTSSRRWILDAIDGTVDFSAGGPDWGTLIALECDGRLVLGVAEMSGRARRYWAAAGQGAFCAGSDGVPQKLNVAAAVDLATARTYVPPAEWASNDRARRIVAALSRASSPIEALEHPALLVASGRFDVAVFLIAGPWDLAAPALIVEEAGGRFSDLDGRADLFSGTAVFSNGHLHEAVVRVTGAA